MKKKIAGLLAGLMVLSMGTVVFAAPSPDTTSTATDVTIASSASDTLKQQAGDIKEVAAPADKAEKVEVVEVKDTKVITAVSTQVKALGTKAVKELGFFDLDITPKAGVKEVPVTFSVDGVKAGDKVMALHQKKDGTWEKIAASEVKDGKVVVNFTSFSPVVLVKVTTYKTGSTAPVLAIIAMICLAGVVICGRKVKFNN